MGKVAGWESAMVPDTGVKSPNNGLGTMAQLTEKMLKITVKWHYGPKFSSPAARFKRLRLGGTIIILPPPDPPPAP